MIAANTRRAPIGWTVMGWFLLSVLFLDAEIAAKTSSSPAVAASAENATTKQESDAGPAMVDPASSDRSSTQGSAHELVRDANRLLQGGKANEALDRYNAADQLRSDAPEILFSRGLAQYTLEDFASARKSFQRAVEKGDRSLALDAAYSLGAADHQEALQNRNDPSKALPLLESAMQQYHSVLAKNGQHAAARESNFKAASVWKQLKQIQKQEQKEKQDQEGQKEKSEDPQDQDKPGDPQHNQQQQEQSDPENKDASQPQDSQSQEGESKDDAQGKKMNPRKDSPASENSEPQPSEESESMTEEQKQEQISKEQAERRLREMMQTIRQRTKNRPQPGKPIPQPPMTKDW